MKNLQQKPIDMTKIYLLCFSISLLLSTALAAQDIDVPQTHHPLITKRTASWCPKCGGYGWELFRNLLNDNSKEALVLAAHYGGSAYENAVSTDLVAELGGFGQPLFFLNTTDLGVTSSNIDQVRQDVQGQVDQINAELPTAQTGLLAYPDAMAEELVIRTKTRFFEETAQEVHLAVYLMQPSFIGTQSGQGSDAEHKNLLRMAVGGNTFGESLGDVFPEGEEVEREYSVSYSDLQSAGFDDLSSLGDSSLIVGAVLWTGESGNRSVLNTNHVRETTLTSVQSLASVQAFELFPLPAADQVTVRLELEQAWPQAQLQLVDAQGRLLRQVFQGELPNGMQTFELHRAGLPAGQYWLRLTDGARVAVRALVFR